MKLNQVTIPSLDVERSISFYKNLGLELIVYSSEHYARFVVPGNEAALSVHKYDELSGGHRVVVYFEIKELDLRVQELKDKGFIFEVDPVDQPWLWREAKLLDPDQNEIILYFAGENRLNPPWRL